VIRILDRLVARTFLKLFVVFLSAAPFLFVVFDLTENLDTYLDRGLTPLDVIMAQVYQMPLFLQQSFPIAALIATVFTVFGMTTHREIVAAKAGGISFHRVVRPIVVVGIMLTGVALLLSEVVPRANRRAAQILSLQDPGRTWRTDFVYESTDGLTWQVGRLTAPDGRIRNLLLEKPAKDGAPGVHLTADMAEWEEGEGWTFLRGYIRQLRADSTERAYQFERAMLAGITERPEELLERPRQPEEMTYAELTRQAEIIERTGGDALDLLVKREQKLSIPLATLVVILFGAPLATSSRRGGTAYGIGVSLGTVMLYILLLRLSGALAQAGAVPLLPAAWTPNAVFFVGALILLARVRT
jgi:lipopolysaccharide export system permease protein